MSTVAFDKPDTPVPRGERVVRFLGWASLFGLITACMLPNLAAVKNIAAGLGLLVLIAAKTGKWFPGVSARYVRVCLLAYMAAVMVSAIVPNLVFLPDTANLNLSLHAAWNTFTAMIGAGLVVLLLRGKGELRLLCAIWLIMIAAIVTGELIQTYLEGMTRCRLSGTKGDPNRYALMLFLGLVPMAMMWFVRELRQGHYPAWLVYPGFLTAIVTPMLMNRKRLVNYNQVCDKWDTLLTVCLTVGLMAFWWFVFFRVARARSWLLLLTFCLFLLNIGLAATRSVMVALCVWLLIAGIIGIKRQYLVSALAVILVGAGWLLYVRYSDYGTPLGKDFAVRAFIARGGVRIFRKHPVLGAGYGIMAFRREWPFKPPYPEPVGKQANWPPFHAHNLTVQVMATQGLTGLAAFESLWLAGMVFLYRRMRKCFSGVPINRILSAMAADAEGYKAIVIAALGSLLILQVIGVFTVPLIKGNEVLLWVVVAMGFAGGHEENIAKSCE